MRVRASMLMLVVSVAMVAAADESSGTLLSVEPPEYVVPGPGVTFTINITVTNVTRLHHILFKLWYNSTLINATDVVAGPVWWTDYAEVEDLTVIGRVYYGITFVEASPSFDGTGVVATITFTATAVGESILHLNETAMIDNTVMHMPIPHTTVDGTVRIRVMGDVNGDGEVDILDVGTVCSVFALPLSDQQKATAYPFADLDGNGAVDILDVGTVCSCYAAGYQCP